MHQCILLSYSLLMFTSREIQKHWRFEESPITAIAAIEGIGIAGGFMNGLIQVIDNDTGRVHQVLAGHTAPVTCLFYAAEAKRLVSASESDGEVRLWVPGSEQCYCTIKTPVQHVKRIESTDMFAAASRDSLDIRIWNILDRYSSLYMSLLKL